jgi:outer membrane protein assembly factor BamE (lipoprotein component of BamABCDE complex)
MHEGDVVLLCERRKNTVMNKLYTSMFVSILLAGCAPAWQHSQDLHSHTDRELTVGVVQRDIRRGMSAAEVSQALGSPNIVTKDSDNSQTWIYDKIATEASYSNDGGGIFLILGSYNSAAGASATTQRTLTVIIKFDDHDHVRDVSYHGSKF